MIEGRAEKKESLANGIVGWFDGVELCCLIEFPLHALKHIASINMYAGFQAHVKTSLSKVFS